MKRDFDRIILQAENLILEAKDKGYGRLAIVLQDAIYGWTEEGAKGGL